MKAKEAFKKSKLIRLSLVSNVTNLKEALLHISAASDYGRYSCDLQFEPKFQFMLIVKQLFKLGYSINIDRDYPSDNYFSTVYVSWGSLIGKHKAGIINKDKWMAKVNCEVG